MEYKKLQEEKNMVTGTQIDEYYNDPDFKNVKSSSSTYVSEIKGMVFGGFNSRFWMLRKHLNSMSVEELENSCLHSWECLSL